MLNPCNQTKLFGFNKIFKEFTNLYAESFFNALKSLSEEALKSAYELILDTSNKKGFTTWFFIVIYSPLGFITYIF